VPPPLPTIATTRILLPPAAIVNGEVKQVSLEEYKDKYVILFFYPKDFT
jgi:alkyl hydroperoxide reductase subunit AhpC